MIIIIQQTLYTLSDVYLKQKMYKKCEEIAFQALNIDSTDIYTNSILYTNIAQANIYMGNSQKGIEYFRKTLESNRVYSNQNFQASLSEMEVKYETEKKESKITALETEKTLLKKEKHLSIGLGIAGGAVLLLLLAFYIVRQRLIQQKVARLEQEKKLIATQAVLDGETAERNRLARDLHDGLGSLLSVVKLNLQEMKQGAVIKADDIKQLNKATDLLDESIRELRRVAHHMMPESLMRYGLKVSLNDFCNTIPSARFHYFGNEQRLNNKLETLIYRSVHELVNNALKHAKSTQINIQLVQEDNRISLTVQDDGMGFDTTSVYKGMGLENIRNRVEAYNGKMNLYSSPGNGTEINIELLIHS